MSKDSTQSFKAAFGKFLKEEHLDDKFKEKQLIESWERIMGRPISARTSKMFFRDGIFFVELTSASLKEEMNRSKELVQDRIREQMGELIFNEIRFI